MFASVLIKKSDNKYVSYFNQHHLITDGWSVAVLYKKMIELYSSSVKGELANTTELPAYDVYKTYELKQRENNCEADFWTNQLHHLPVTPKLYGCSNAGSGSHQNNPRK